MTIRLLPTLLSILAFAASILPAVATVSGDSRASLNTNARASHVTRVACVGNSITYGLTIPHRERNAYPARLAELLGPQFQVANFGHSGATLLTDGHRPYIRQPEFRRALDFRPDIAVIHLGINDTDPRNWPRFADRFTSDYCALIDSFRAVNPRVRIILANLTPIRASHPRFRTGTRLWRDLIRDEIPRIAAITRSELIDLQTPLLDHPQLIHDGVHPDSLGALLMARYIANAIAPRKSAPRFAPVFQDSMILQRHRPLHIYGSATPGQRLSVTLDNRSYPTTAKPDGTWSVTTQPLFATGPHTLALHTPDTLVTLRNILAGELWIASGQSNMERPLELTDSATLFAASAHDPFLRILDCTSPVKAHDCVWDSTTLARVDALDILGSPRWSTVNPANALHLPAIPFHFIRQLRDSLHVPVGIIANAYGGAPAESFVDIETLRRHMPGMLVDWRRNDYLMPWCRQRAIHNAGTTHRHPFEPSYMFAAAIRPLGPLDIAGVIWYQGESNAHNTDLHEAIFPLLVDSWRRHFRNPALPFLTVQLSSIDRPSWPRFRNSQRTLAQSIPGVHMAVSSDLGDSLEVHPSSKLPVAQRLARLALHHVYLHSSLTPAGPDPVSATATDSGAVVITFRNASALLPANGREIIGFELAEHPSLFHKARAIPSPGHPDRLILKAMDINHPRFVRYAWQPFTRANLVNADSLPASTFAIDVDGAAPLLPQPTPGYDEGVSAPFAAPLADGIVMAGGCNFPGNPFAPDARKRFYADIYYIPVSPADSAMAQPICIGALPAPVAYGASAITPRGLVMIGGSNDSGSLTDVRILALDSDLTPRISSLPSLPAPIDNMAAAAIGSRIYVAGGNLDGKPSRSLLMLDIDNPADGWTTLSPMPGNPRTQPVMVAAPAPDGSETQLYLWGGFAGAHDNKAPTLDTDGLRFSPRTGKWHRIPAPVDSDGNTVSLGGGVAVTLPSGNIIATGGVNKTIFLNALKALPEGYLTHDPEWYRFNPLLLQFDTATGRWSAPLAGDPAMARAGAAAVTLHGNIYLLGGEIKPRVRTPYNTAITSLKP